MRRALIVKLGAIGDVIMAVPAAYKLMEAGYAVDWIAGAAAASVLRSFPEIHVIEADERLLLRGTWTERLRMLMKLWRELRANRYDYVATLYYDRRYRVLTLPLRARRRVHLVRGDRRLELLAGRHHTDEFARILLSATATGSDAGPVPQSLSPVFATKLPNSPLAPRVRRRITLAPGGAKNLLRDDMLRRWPAELYAELATSLLAANYEVVLTGGPDDVWVREYFAGVPCTDLIGTLSLPELMSVFNHSDAVVTHDSGPLHLAGCTRCALLGIFGPVDPWGRLPRRAGSVAIWGGEGFACRPCYDGGGYADCTDNQCMSQVTVALVLSTLSQLLEDRDAGEPKPYAVLLPQPLPPNRPVQISETVCV